MTLSVRFVASDGTYRLGGVRVRCAPGHGKGSLRDEYERGVITPFAGESGLIATLRCMSEPELLEFARGLPIARLATPS